MMQEVEQIIFPLIFIIAMLYASVGHGGASGYLAIMALLGMDPVFMKPAALLLNLFVSLTAFLLYRKAGHFSWKLFFPFAIASIPASYLGGYIQLDVLLYKKILGCVLLIPAFRLLSMPDKDSQMARTPSIAISVFAGALIGLLSGMIGIGGGILLSPLLLLAGWADQKKAAAVSSLFIFVNSLSGLAGQWRSGISFQHEMFLLAGIAFAGGIAGAWLGAMHLSQTVLRYVLAAVLTLASIKLLMS